ncbi:hypothetical protein SAMN04488008_11080 [Maribacter orientalis]|uniref:Uncharacterized protein n=1 Tax=Maribacter orientalis TaxID=228957 RepID=A0A1H7W4B0_9FLAO|nr:hypothetical protein SAMN04488008_11080 [Maribacter orientalis]
MKSSTKNTIISLFRRIDKAVFDMHRKGRAWKTKKVPHWIVLVLGLVLYLLVLWLLWPFLSAQGIPYLNYFGFFLLLVFTIVFLVLSKIYVSQLLNYKSPYSVRKERTGAREDDRRYRAPLRFDQLVHKIDYDNSDLFQDYLKTNREDFSKLLSGNQVSEKLIWLTLTDRKLPNFRLLFEFLNHISEENLEGYYGENLLRLCNYIKTTFRSKNSEWTVKQLQKSHSSWKNCNPKRRMDLKIDIENQLLSTGKE